MSYYDYEEEFYYEPSPADEVIHEFKERMKDVLLDSVKNEINIIKDENERLKQENEKYRKRENELHRKESELKCKESELKCKESNLEYQFYQKKFSELLDPFVENYICYYAETEYKKRPKCNHCNEDRMITYIAPNGKTIEKQCDCAGLDSYYAPTEAKIMKFDLWKSKRDKEFVITPEYENKSDDDVRWSSLKLKTVVGSFDESKSDDIRRYETVFSSEEECQKYCNWLNSKEKRVTAVPRKK